MSGLMHKVKDALSGEKNTPEARAANQGHNEYGSGHGTGTTDTTGTTGGDYGRDTTGTGSGYGTSGYDDNTRTSGSGPHSSGMMNKADPRIDSDRDGRTGMGSTGTTGTTGGDYGRDTTTTGTGYGSSGYDSNTRTSGAGPHDSSMMNKADPRVDSDRDGRSGIGGTGTTGTGTSGYGTSGHGTSGYDSTTGTSGSGPHSSSMMNKADPRVDSDRDGRSGLGGTSGTSGYDNTSTGGTTGSGHHGHHGHHGGLTGKAEDIIHGGDHHTSTANKLDPHVSGGGNLENIAGTTGTTGTSTGMGSSSGYDDTSRTSGAGPHSSSMMNKADPRVDSDRDGRSGMGGSTTGTGYGNDTRSGYGDNSSSGYGSNTGVSGAGPHSSSMMNKADPRVDSDRDGRTGMGGNNTSGSTGYGSGTGSGTTGYGSGDRNY